MKQTADTFLTTSEAVASWPARLGEEGTKALVQLPEPVSRFPDLLRRLKTPCPAMGKVRIADTLYRAGLRLGATAIGRILQEERIPDPGDDEDSLGPVVTSKRPNHVWRVDLTVIPASSGFWTSWPPFPLPQQWPFCWRVVVVLDHYSRGVLGIGAFRACPASVAI